MGFLFQREGFLEMVRVVGRERKRKRAVKVKPLSVKVRVIIISTLLFVIGCHTTAMKTEFPKSVKWKHYNENEDSHYFYDTENIRRVSKYIVRVWTSMEYTEKGITHINETARKEHGDKFKNKYSKIAFGIGLSEVNCKEKMYRGLRAIAFANDGNIIEDDESKSKWRFILPGSVFESLYEELCK
jgi:hypothetical protein